MSTLSKFTVGVAGLLLVLLVIAWLLQRDRAASLAQQVQAQQRQLDEAGIENQRLSNLLARAESRIGGGNGREKDRDKLLEDVLKLRNEVSALRRLTNVTTNMPTILHEARVGEHVSLTYDPAIWKSHSAVNGSVIRSMTWDIIQEPWLQLTVAEHAEQKTEDDCRKEQLTTQRLRGDPTELIGERHESIAGRNWFVMEFRNTGQRPPALELHYFLPTGDGHIQVFIAGEETGLPTHRQAIESFLSQIQITEP